MSNYFRSRRIVTVLGGPHARSYPGDACRYFDFVLGLTDKDLLKQLLQDFKLNGKEGTYLAASSQPLSIPGVRDRWEFIEKVHHEASFIKVIPMIGSFGCPYHCNFCIDSEKYRSKELYMGELLPAFHRSPELQLFCQVNVQALFCQ